MPIRTVRSAPRTSRRTGEDVEILPGDSEWDPEGEPLEFPADEEEFDLLLDQAPPNWEMGMTAAWY